MKAAAARKTSSNFSLLPIFFLIVLIGILAVSFLPQTVEACLLRHLSQATGLQVKMGSFRLHYRGSLLKMKDLEFLNPKGFPEGKLAQIGEARVDFSWRDILSRRGKTRQVMLNFKEFRLMKNETGLLNLPPIQKDTKEKTLFEEVVLNLDPVTYTDLSAGKQPVQKTFSASLNHAVYRNVKGVAGIVEIVNWEILKRTGIQEEPAPALSQIGPSTQPVSLPPAQPAAVPLKAPSSKSN